MVEKKRILLFSTGMDSIIVKHLHHFSNDECLFIRMGTAENKIEEALVHKYFPGVRIADLPIGQYSLSNNIIPFRNYMLALVAAQYGNEICFGFTAGDTTKDKDYVFKAQVEAMLNYFATDPNKVCIPGPYEITMPYKALTKEEMLRVYIRCGYDVNILINASTSCYEGAEKACGICRSCLRKFVAFYNNGIDISNSLQQVPTKASLVEFYNQCIIKGREKESNEVLQCINTLRQ